MTTRRDFVQRSALGVGALALTQLDAPTPHFTPSVDDAPPPNDAQRAPLNILILGGTGFIGPNQVKYAVARGHKVTVFNRGRRQADLPKGVTHLQGDRATGDLASLKGKKWDVVIDNPTTLPFWVRDAGQVLKDATQHYIFVSTISVYPHYRKAGMDETYELSPYTGAEDPMTIKQVAGPLYGPLKVLSEKEGEKWFPGKTTIVRPGLIVGPGDPTDRFTYWPVRVDRGGEVLCPGTPNDPVQVIDTRDLSEFIIRLAEDKVIGTFNATGPRAPLTMAEMIYGCRAVTSGSNEVKFTWADQKFLGEQQVRGWSDMPTWIPPTSENEGWSRVSIDRAIAKGLTFRPFATTARDTIDWFKTLPAERQANMTSGLKADREKAVLAAWHARSSR